MDTQPSNPFVVSNPPVEGSKVVPTSVPATLPGSPVQAVTAQGDVSLETKKTGRPAGKLGKRTQVFMELILAGHSTLDAYSLAGYKGQKNAAYVLRSQLKDRIEERLLNDGVSREGAKLQLQELLNLPLDPNIKTRGVSIKEKIMILKFLDKVTEKEEGRKPSITPFNLTIQDPKSVTINEGSK
jgi:hypothetical protein